MNNNSNLQQYKREKLSELKTLTNQIDKYFQKLGKPDPKQRFFPINDYRKEVNDWIKVNMDKLCRSKKDVDTVFNWKEAEYQNLLLMFRKKEIQKYRKRRYNHGRGEYVKTAEQEQENNNVARNDEKYSKANVTKLHKFFRELQNREFERVKRERRAAKSSQKAQKNSTRNSVSTQSRVRSIRNASASAAARSSSAAQLSSMKYEQKGRFLVSRADGRKLRRHQTKRRQAKRKQRGSKKKGRSLRA